MELTFSGVILVTQFGSEGIIMIRAKVANELIFLAPNDLK